MSTYPALKISEVFSKSVEIGILLTEPAQKLRRKNADVTDAYFILLDAGGISPTVVLSQNQRKTDLGFFQNLITRSCKGFTEKLGLLMGLRKTQ